MTRCRPTLVTTSVACTVLAGAACDPSPGIDPSRVVVRDSAGIKIVESFAGAWAMQPGWTVGSEPVLEIGLQQGPAEYMFHEIRGAGRLGGGKLFVVDGGSGEIRIFDGGGTFLSATGRPGDGPGEFSNIRSVGVGRGDTIYVYDRGHRRVSFLSSEGDFVRGVTLRPETSGRLWDVRWLPDRGFVGDVHSFDKLRTEPDGVTLATMIYVRFSAGGAQTSVIAEGPGIEAVRAFRTQEFWTFRIPAVGYRPAAAVGPGALYFGLSRRMEVGVMGLDGEMRAVIRQMNLDQTLTEEMARQAALASIARSMPDEDPVRVYESADIVPSGSILPPYSRMEVDDGGYLWVAEYVDFDLDARNWTVFSPDGVLMGSVEVPEGFRILQVGDDEVIGRFRDELGIEFLWSLPLSRS